MANSRSSAGSSSATTLCYIIAYDISDDRRRTKVHKILCGFGKWTQYSLFECFLTKKELVLLRHKLAKHLVAERDSVRFYPLCGACLNKVETVGGEPPSEDVLFVI
jgi:CRISPR-associated protein Cas2